MTLVPGLTIRYWVAGEPIPQGSKRVWRGKDGNVHMLEDAGVRHTTWRHELASTARRAMLQVRDAGQGDGFPFRGPVSLTLTFTQHRPKTHYGTGRNDRVLKSSAPDLPLKAPDVDKLARAVLDSMTSIVYVDDAQVVRLTAVKVFVHLWEEEGVAVNIQLLGREDDGLE